MKRKLKKKIEQLMASVSMVYRWWDLVLISFVTDFFLSLFPMFFSPTFFSLLDFVRESESAPITSLG